MNFIIKTQQFMLSKYSFFAHKNVLITLQLTFQHFVDEIKRK